MKNVFILICMFVCTCNFIMSQDTVDHADGGSYIKTIEYNVLHPGMTEDELWSLSIHQPQGKALLLSNLFRQIISDSLDNKINEDKYLKLLDEI